MLFIGEKSSKDCTFQDEVPSLNLKQEFMPYHSLHKNPKTCTFYSLWAFDFETTEIPSPNPKHFVYAAGFHHINLRYNDRKSWMYHWNGRQSGDINCPGYDPIYNERTKIKCMRDLEAFYKENYSHGRNIYNWEDTKQFYENTKNNFTDLFLKYHDLWARDSSHDIIPEMIDTIIETELAPIRRKQEYLKDKPPAVQDPVFSGNPDKQWCYPQVFHINLFARNGRRYDHSFVLKSNYWFNGNWKQGKIIGGATCIKSAIIEKDFPIETGDGIKNVKIKIHLSDSLNYVKNSLDNLTKTAAVPYTSRKKANDHKKINATNYHSYPKLREYLYYDVECLCYIMFYLNNLLFSIFNFNGDLNEEHFNDEYFFRSYWLSTRLFGYPDYMNYLHRLFKSPFNIAMTMASCAKTLIKVYGLK